MTPRPFLQDLPAYVKARDPHLLEVERNLMAYLDDEYRAKQPHPSWDEIAKAVGHKGTGSSFAATHGQVYRAAYRYLTDPKYRAKMQKMPLDKLAKPTYLIGVRKLMDAGIETWEQLDGRVPRTAPRQTRLSPLVGTPGEPVTRKEALDIAHRVRLRAERERIEAADREARTTAPGRFGQEAAVLHAASNAEDAMRRLFQEVLTAWAAQVEATKALESRVALLEQSKQSLAGENRALEALLAEFEADQRDVKTSLDAPLVLPERPTLDAAESKNGTAMPFDYSDRFQRRFDGMKAHERKQVVKALERIHRRPSSKLTVGAPFSVPDGTLSSRVALKWRLFWRPQGGKLRVYDLVPKSEYTERRHK